MKALKAALVAPAIGVTTRGQRVPKGAAAACEGKALKGENPMSAYRAK